VRIECEAVADALRPGSRATVQELALIKRAWTFPLSEVKTPVHLWHGALDRNAANASSDKLKISQGLAPGRPTEEQIAQAKQAQASNARVAELSKNISELNKIQAASGAAPAPAAAPEPAAESAPEPTPESAPESVPPVWAWLVVLKSWRGLLLVLLLIAPWLVAITIQSRGAFFEQSLGDDFAAKMAGGQESHGGWPGYYLLLSAAAFWPTILFVLPGIATAVSRRAEPAIRFLLVWAASWWLVVELVPTKLPHYVIDAYPALAILAALFVLDPRPVKFLAPARWIAIVQFVIGAGLLTAAVILAPRYFGKMEG